MNKKILSLSVIIVLLSFLVLGCPPTTEPENRYTLTIINRYSTGSKTNTITSTISEFPAEWAKIEEPIPSSDAYIFEGYFIDEELTTEFQVKDFTQDSTIYVKWGVKGLDYEIIDGKAHVSGDTNSTETEIIIPDEIGGNSVVIKEGAFKNNTTITKVTIEDADVSKEAFWGCTKLKVVILETNYNELHENAFAKTKDIQVAYKDSRSTSAVHIDEKCFGYDDILGENTEAENATLYYPETRSLATIRNTFELKEEVGVIKIYFSGEYSKDENGLPTNLEA